MGKIELLSDNVINQIAAGEVIARPASCVKELLENSVDSGAKNIEISVEKAGKKLIQVKDDGCGMDAADLKKAFLRHATSKIRSLNDLNYIETMGFRGEALASIASVARVEAVSRNDGSETGNFISLEAGRITDETIKASNHGTVISVKELFFNTPARLKFLKSDSTEESNIMETVISAGFAHDDISFRLLCGGRETFFFHTGASLKERIRIIYGADVAASLVEISSFTDNVKITGFVSKPSVTRSTRSGQHLFVNLRNVQSRSLPYAVYEGFGTLLMKGRYPYSFVFVDINPSLVDVNVHPAKSEVKFRDERFVFNCIKSAVENGLKMTELTPAASAGDASGEGYKNFGVLLPAAGAEGDFVSESTGELFSSPNIGVKEGDRVFEVKSSTRNYLWLNVLGQLHETYIVGEDDNNLVLIDQHAAHEKMLFESIMDSVEKDKVAVQEMLIPEVIDVTPQDKKRLIESHAIFARLGFILEEFGESSFKIEAHPVIIGDKQPSKFVREMLEQLAEKGTAGPMDALKGLCATMACRAAVKAGDKLNDAQIRSLIEGYVELKDPHSCPHGRPPVIKMAFEEIEKLFKRKL
jgi:DNA mismatch repair protein MutL